MVVIGRKRGQGGGPFPFEMGLWRRGDVRLEYMNARTRQEKVTVFYQGAKRNKKKGDCGLDNYCRGSVHLSVHKLSEQRRAAGGGAGGGGAGIYAMPESWFIYYEREKTTPVTQIFLLVRRGCRGPKSF